MDEGSSVKIKSFSYEAKASELILYQIAQLYVICCTITFVL